MQVQKDRVKQGILKQAKKEFIEYGFAKASMRRIANEVDISVSNMYNYFRSKDSIFFEIVKSPITKIDECFSLMEQDQSYIFQEYWSFDSYLKLTNIIAGFIEENREALTLLAFKSGGSIYEDYKDEIVDRYTNIFGQWMEKVGHFSEIESKITNFTLHNLASFSINIVLESLMYNVSYENMVKHLEEIIIFMFYGYEGLAERDYDVITQPA